MRYFLALACVLMSAAAGAADKAGYAPAAAAAGGPYSGTATVAGIAQWFLSSVLVIGLIFLCAFLARKLRLVPSAKAGAPRVLQVLPLGGKHRIAAVEIMNKVLIVGITPSGMSLLAGPFNPEELSSLPDSAGQAGSGPGTAEKGKEASSFRSVLESFAREPEQGADEGRAEAESAGKQEL